MIGVTWLLPAAFAGLALVALPIAIHLLVRQRSVRVSFPSLRFLQASRMAALRTRTIRDVALLICRAAIVVAAALALASPVFLTPGREATYRSRLARAIVVPSGDDVTVARTHEQGAMAARVFSRAAVADAVADASAWLSAQPPSMREVLIVSPFKSDQVTEADLAGIEPGVGLRLVRAPGQSPPIVDFAILSRRDSDVVLVNRHVRLDPTSTTVTGETVVETLPRTPIDVTAAESDRAVADAALRAVLEVGVRWPQGTKPITVRWNGSNLASSASELKRAIDAAVRAPTVTLEPTTISDAQLAQWSRPASSPLGTDTPVDEGDRRWLWGAALLLLAAEAVLRRSTATERNAVTAVEEARVA